MNALLISSAISGSLLLGLLFIFGIRAVVLSDTRKAAWAEGIAHGGTALMAISMACFLVSAMKKLLENFDTELPALTMLMIQLSDIVINFWYIVLPFGLVPAVAVDVLIFRYFHRHPETRFAARVMSLVISLLMLGQVVIATLGIALAFTKLLNTQA
ncbi:hypothetical protein GC163_14890 [bacterium]|nr:hypothetical protein [bacterium]